MRLAQFIRIAKREILDESIAYAASFPALKGVEPHVLEDRLPWVLDAIAQDLEQPQSRDQSIDKSHGRIPPPEAQTAAQTHGVQRARLGLDIEQVVSEYRVLRASVLRLWAEGYAPDLCVTGDLMRFNEAIDQAVAESVSFHATELKKWRDIALGVLGNDLRGPLSAVQLTAEVLLRESSGKPQDLTASILRSTKRLGSLLDALLEYNKATLGNGMELSRAGVDLGTACHDEVQMLQLAFPASTLNYRMRGDTRGLFDASRVREALTNLVSNAVQHSSKGCVVEVQVVGHEAAVEIVVENQAEPMAPEVLNSLFEPMARHAQGSRGSSGNLGLGLFIVREIAHAHGGEVSAVSGAHTIRFSILLPRS